ncbi:MAG: antitoxin [Micropepsaceae bacterium]
MRTTLDIDDDVLKAAKALAQQTDRTVGEVLSDLVRQALMYPSKTDGTTARPGVGGFVPFKSRGGVLTNDQIDRLRNGDVY